MAAIVYLEPDDEITSAAARMRGIDQIRIALVVPYGSRLATSRINFRLLAREAQGRGRRLSVVAGDAATRALAASAGLPVFGSVAEYEEAEGSSKGPSAGGTSSGPDVGESTRAIAATGAVAAATGTTARRRPPPGADAAGPPASTSSGPRGRAGAAPRAEPEPAEPDLDETTVMPAVEAPASRGTRPRTADRPATAATDAHRSATSAGVPAAASTSARPAARPADSLADRGRGRWPWGRTAGIVAAALVALAVLAGGVGAYLLLPSADVTIRARAEQIGPVSLEIRADPEVTEPNAAASVVPAERLTFEVAVSDTFAATGERVEESAASGSVTFSNLNTGGSTAIPAGAVVSTEGGIRFRTTQAVTLPAAQLILGEPIRVEPATAEVGVTATESGPEGNVPANAITIVPEGQDPTLVKVNNPSGTSGGVSERFPRVRRADVDAALAELTTRLDEEFAAMLADPNRVPEGMTVFADTAVLGEPQPTTNPDGLVDQEIAEFELGLAATGTAIAVDARPVESIAVTHITSRVEDGYRLVDGSVDVAPGEPRVERGTVIYPVSATAAQIRTVDGDALREQIKGKPVDEARAFLAAYGTVDLRVWPDWVNSIPTLDSRVSLRVEDESNGAAPGASRSPSETPASGASGSPAGAASGSPAGSSGASTAPGASANPGSSDEAAPSTP